MSSITIKFDKENNIAYISNNNYIIEASCDANVSGYDFEAVYNKLYNLAYEFELDLSSICDDDDPEALRFVDFCLYLTERIVKDDDEEGLYYINL